MKMTKNEFVQRLTFAAMARSIDSGNLGGHCHGGKPYAVQAAEGAKQAADSIAKVDPQFFDPVDTYVNRGPG